MSITTTESGLQIEEIRVGEGESATSGKFVSVHYTGWLTNGTKFDSSKDRDEPFEFPLGQRNVIATGIQDRIARYPLTHDRYPAQAARSACKEHGKRDTDQTRAQTAAQGCTRI